MSIETIPAPDEGPVLRGDVLGGVLLRGWTGPRIVQEDTNDWPSAPIWDGIPLVDGDGAPGLFQDADFPVLLDCHHPEVRDRIVRVLAEGERCPTCSGSGVVGACVGCGRHEDDPENGWRPCGSREGHGCVIHDAPCGCDGHLRAPVHLGAITDAERRGTMTAEVAAWLLWVSVLRADAGLPPIGAGVTFHYGGDHLLLPHPDGVMRVDLGCGQ